MNRYDIILGKEPPKQSVEEQQAIIRKLAEDLSTVTGISVDEAITQMNKALDGNIYSATNLIIETAKRIHLKKLESRFKSGGIVQQNRQYYSAIDDNEFVINSNHPPPAYVQILNHCGMYSTQLQNFSITAQGQNNDRT